jgi:ABC-type uncharacterized transport system permease subunit
MSLNPGFWVQNLHQAVTFATPLAIAGLGELLAETAGVLNLGVEGTMLIGAVAAYGTALATHSLLLALLAGAAVGLLFGLLHAFLTVTLGINQIAVGLTLVFLGTGLSGYLGQGIAGAPVPESFAVPVLPLLDRIPVLGAILFTQDWVVYATLLLAVLIWAMLRYTVLGLNLRATGEDPAATDAAGVPVALIRYLAVGSGGALAGVAGGYFAIAIARAWADQVTAGQGWIAISLVIAANWRPLWLLSIAFLFGIVDSLYFSLQVVGINIPSSLLQMLPYVFSLAVLFGHVLLRQGAAGLGPAALGRAYHREERV